MADRVGRASIASSGRAWWLTGLLEGAFVVLSLMVVAGVHESASTAAAVTMWAVVAVTTGLTMHMSLAHGQVRAVALTTGLAALLVMLGASPSLLAVVVVTGLCGAKAVAHSASRASVLRAGVWTGVIGALSRVGVALLVPRSTAWHLVAESAGAGAGGLLGASAVLGIGPIAEWVFGHTTRLTMNERLDFDHPLLRSLMNAAPGTFQHSVNVGVLADAAASAIHADALVARVGGLYHDVGKMRAPTFFIENQRDVNPHDGLDPRESAAILRAHVSDGVDLVRAHGLGERIVDFVREHHGTCVMRPFQAKAAGLDRSPEPEHTYRYSGPAPRSRETAIVMIADQLEATARAAPPADDAARHEVVRRTLAHIRDENQLEASGLSSDDLTAIQTGLERALGAMYHHRMTYPLAAAVPPRRSPLADVKRLLRRSRWSFR